jgi:hypothetical protein
MPELAIDMSNYTTAFSEDTARAMYADGVRRAIVQFVNPYRSEYEQQIPALQAAGIEVEGYVFLWFSASEENLVERVRWACEESKRFGIKRMWLDCEETLENGYGFDHLTMPVSPKIRAAVEQVKRSYGDWVRMLENGVPMMPKVGIYTAQWWWVPGASNSDEWSRQGIPLWDAHYDLDPDIDDANYGGWVRPEMSQYQGWGEIAGVGGIDLNSYEMDLKDQAVAAAIRTLTMNWEATAAFFRGISDNAAELITDGAATVELMVSGAPTQWNGKPVDAYMVLLPAGAGRQTA